MNQIGPETAQNQLNSTSNALAELIDRLSIDQIRFIVARQHRGTDKEAARDIGISPSTVKRWKGDGVPIDDAIKFMLADGVVVAQEVRRRNLAKAMLVKVAGLDSDDERLRQGTATEIIEWEMGKAIQRQQVTGADDGPLVVRYVNDWRDQTADAPSRATGNIKPSG